MNLLYGQSNFAVNSGPTKITMINVGKNRKAYKHKRVHGGHLDVLLRELVVIHSSLVDDLCDSDDLAVVVADRHADQRGRLISGLAVDLTIESRILKHKI